MQTKSFVSVNTHWNVKLKSDLCKSTLLVIALHSLWCLWSHIHSQILWQICKNYSASKINWQKKRAKNNLKNIFILFLHTKPQSKHTHSLTTCKTSHIHINNLYSVWSLLKLNLVHKCGILNGGVFSQGLLFLDIKNLVLGFAKKSYFTTECKADTGTETIYSVHF